MSYGSKKKKKNLENKSLIIDIAWIKDTLFIFLVSNVTLVATSQRITDWKDKKEGKEKKEKLRATFHENRH